MSGSNTDDPIDSYGFGFNPVAASLAGMAGGFAKAAMPSDRPVPLGAGLGLAAEGAQQGLLSSLAGAVEAQKYKAALLNNQLLSAAVPARVAMMNHAAQIMKASGGAPMGVPTVTNPFNGDTSGGASSAPATASGSNVGGLEVSPADMTGLGYMFAGMGDPGAASRMFSTRQTALGGAGYAALPNGTVVNQPGYVGALAQRTGAEKWAGVPAAVTQAAGVAQAQANLDLVKVPVSDGQDGIVEKLMPRSQAALILGQQGAQALPSFSAQPTGGGNLAPLMPYADRVNGLENSTGNPAARNPNSSATGNGQFIDSTWLKLFPQVYPQLAQGASDQQMLAYRADPQVSRSMTAAYAAQNAPLLQQAGFQPTAPNLYLAHRLGPQGAINVLKGAQANPTAPVSRFVDADAANANPAFKLIGAANFVQSARQRMGDGVAPPAQPTVQPVAAAGPAPATATGSLPAAQLASPPAGRAVGMPVLTPNQQFQQRLDEQSHQAALTRQNQANEAALAEQKAEAEAYGGVSKQIIEAGQKASVGLQRLDVIDNATRDFRPGTSGQMRLAAGKAMADTLQSMGVTPPDWVTKGAAAGETIAKEGGYLATELTRSLGSREALGVFNQVKSIMPNLEMSQGGFQVIVNSLRQGLQRDQDLARFREAWVSDPTHSNSIRGMEAAFEKQYPVETYASRVAPYPMPKTATQAVPNTIYTTARGPALWTGSEFRPVGTGGY